MVSGTLECNVLRPDFPESWLQPDWPAPTRVRAVMTDRHGGVSAAPYDSLNLGDHVCDQVASVLANRAILAEAVGRRPVFLQQVHGVDCVTLGATTPDGVAADACMSTTADVACTIMVADCLPVLLCDASGTWVAAAHAGWRGLAGQGGVGVLEALIASLSPMADRRADILAWLGPCIGPQAFEVGPEVRAAFCTTDASAEACFVPHADGKFLADLPGLARRRLQQLGITQIFGNDSQPAWCTALQASRFFSHRRDSRVLGQSGRMAACIWLEP
ncbi:MAG: Laccase domain protein YfiH [Pseudomonadota bacterium]